MIIILDYLLVFVISTLPVFELRGSIPAAAAMGISPGAAYILGVCGSILPAFPIVLYLTPIAEYLRKTLLYPIINWAMARGIRRSNRIKQFKWLGLFLFVAIPFPTTGVWTGSLIASVLGMNLKQALPPIVAGTMVAGLIVLKIAYRLPWFGG